MVNITEKIKEFVAQCEASVSKLTRRQDRGGDEADAE
jgi:hypothetical protein